MVVYVLRMTVKMAMNIMYFKNFKKNFYTVGIVSVFDFLPFDHKDTFQICMSPDHFFYFASGQ